MRFTSNQISKDHHAQLQRAALFSSPILGLLGLIPMALFFNSSSQETIVLIRASPHLYLTGFLAISSMIYAVWQINIQLRYVEQDKASSKNFAVRPYQAPISFGLVLLITTALIFTRDNIVPTDVGVFKYYPLVGMFANNTIILLLMRSIEDGIEKLHLKLEKADLELKNLMAVHEQLKQQIQPHFLFNALSNLQAMINKKPQVAINYVEVLSSFLRSSIRMNNKNTATVAEELSFFEDYITLQQLRFESSIQIDIQIPEALKKSGKLPVFSLQVLGENAIKHNVFTAAKPLSITIFYDQGWLHIKNNRAPKYDTGHEVSGTGLKNLGERFHLLTTDAPEIQSNSEHYQVSIPIIT